MEYRLNRQAYDLAEFALGNQQRLRIRELAGHPCRMVDFGVQAEGGLEAGCVLARLCSAGYATVDLSDSPFPDLVWPSVRFWTDHPLASCMASQYAGWQISHADYFAMGSGPMRAAAKAEELIAELECGETSDVAVGVLETRQIPPASVCEKIAGRCNVPVERLLLAVAPTASLAGTVQIVARSVETALHKMHELGLELRKVVSGFGCAPLPPVAADDLAAIGRANDAILYGGRVTLWMSGPDQDLESLAARMPSSASRDFGRPFSELFARHDHDFYKLDPHLFSPAAITLISLESGRTFRGGEIRPDILEESFEG